VLLRLSSFFVLREKGKSTTGSADPSAVITVLFHCVALVSFTQLGIHTPWSRSWDRVEPADDSPRNCLQQRACGANRALVCKPIIATMPFHRRPWRQRGPGSDTAQLRSPEMSLIAPLIQGASTCRSYGKNLSPPETTALVTFLDGLFTPDDQPPARQPAARSRARTGEGDCEERSTFVVALPYR